MSIFDIFRRKDNRNNHSFSDEERENSVEIRTGKAELRRIKNQIEIERQKLQLEEARAELEETRSELYGDDDPAEEQPESWDQMAMKALMPMLLSKFAGNAVPASASTIVTDNAITDLTDEQLIEIMEKLAGKAKIKMLKKLSVETRTPLIVKFVPQLDNETAARVAALCDRF